MPKLNSKRFSQPEILRKIRPSSLFKWLAPAQEYFAARGIRFPEPHLTHGGEENLLDYAALAGAFVDPDPEMPQQLVESLQIIN
jgi:hypothetical protein